MSAGGDADMMPSGHTPALASTTRWTIPIAVFITLGLMPASMVQHPTVRGAAVEAAEAASGVQGGGTAARGWLAAAKGIISVSGRTRCTGSLQRWWRLAGRAQAALSEESLSMRAAAMMRNRAVHSDARRDTPADELSQLQPPGPPAPDGLWRAGGGLAGAAESDTGGCAVRSGRGTSASGPAAARRGGLGRRRRTWREAATLTPGGG